ncbi:MAG TPA: bifunctional (p)ppGpp synthetase/guanosine-3',5'-bis(diphosphate) 3'-pyrophosphohydrolase [Alphaproteobacteria bacterium]|nr:bifunctional (p)ppGpp synthetase/guanosine-3',5'-bis(diphosphate) 3'-pyrophosphohydrolase [Alphaproteobacteria bacterium]
MIRQYELVERVKAYDPAADEDLINRAYVFSMKVHGAQRRASGDPYFLHPLEVAGILAGMKLDTGSIVTGLLHDTVEDTVATLEEIEKLFGREIAQLVDGVTKLSKLELQDAESKQAENFRKLVLAMSKDIRVLLVKLCDRLHNMRTLDAIANPDKRRRIARETIEIYAPLAERIGMHEMKDELEDLAFAQLNPEARDSIVRRLSELRQEGVGLVTEVLDELRQVLAEGGVEAAVTGREKRPYSIWRKMQRKNVAFEQLFDIMAFRVMVDTRSDCYQALGIMHDRYQSLPGRFKDFISTPKPNGYQSLHTAVIGPQRQRVEIQIRTREMHEVAELGVAAHWSYKQGAAGAADRPKYRWLQELLEILEHAQRPEEFLEHTKMELFQDQVFCFTPKGTLIALPQGATPVDFAYAVHSEIGDTCVGAKVNGRLVTLRNVLANGDQVEIITSKTSRPSPEWERFAATGKARARIRKFVRQQQRTEYADLGRAMLQKIFRQEGYDFTEKAIDGVLKIFKATVAEDIYANVGAGLTPAREVFHAVFPGHKAATQRPDAKVVPIGRARRSQGKTKDQPVPIRGLIPGMAVHYARCCHPIPGDRIVGIVTTGKGVTIHTIDCETLDSFYDTPERWIDVSWDSGGDGEDHVGRIHAVIANEPGSLGTLSTVIGKNGGNITNLKITSRSTDFFEMLIDIDVSDLKHLNNIVAALRATPVISAVERARSG